jgi:hypothetical protein
LGRLQGYQFGVDLSQDGSHEVNFGNGLSFEIETDQFNTEGASLTTALRYNREAQDLEEFDFSEYADRIREALLIVDEQLLVMGEAKTRIEETNQLRNSCQALPTHPVRLHLMPHRPICYSAEGAAADYLEPSPVARVLAF